VRIATVSQGLDPAIGYLHTSRRGRAALMYDLMEPLRPRVDRLVLAFVLSQTFSPRDLVLGANGVCRLHPQLARRVARLAVDDTEVSQIMTRLIGELRAITLHMAAEIRGNQ
jgi:CRISPR/Cas system-associated endonuclease Cas1